MEWIQYLQGLGIILLILSLLPVMAHFYRKYQVKSLIGHRIKVLEVKPISYKAQLLLIEVEGKRYLLGLTDKGLTLLTELKDGSTGSHSDTNA
jgi:flagellar protein FliO/FliZ